MLSLSGFSSAGCTKACSLHTWDSWSFAQQLHFPWLPHFPPLKDVMMVHINARWNVHWLPNTSESTESTRIGDAISLQQSTSYYRSRKTPISFAPLATALTLILVLRKSWQTARPTFSVCTKLQFTHSWSWADSSPCAACKQSSRSCICWWWKHH